MVKATAKTRLQEVIQHRLAVFGVPHYIIKPFAELVDKWVRCSGVEWTVKRLKSLKVDLYRTRSNLPTLTWQRKNRSGNFSGVIGSLFSYASKSAKAFQAVVHTLMVYSLFKHQKLSAAQQEKFLVAVTSTTNRIAEEFYKDLASFVKSEHPRSRITGTPPALLEYCGSPSKKVPVFSRGSMSQEHSGLISATYFEDSPYHYGLRKKYPSLYDPVVAGINLTSYDELFKRFGRFAAMCPWEEGIFGGEIHFLQEPGLKLRAIASPYLVHQLALKPLGDTLYSLLRTLPWDCTHDHHKPVVPLQEHLTSGQTVHSVDLSSATDYFPLEVQLVVLRSLVGDHPSIDLFSEISRSKWKSSIGEIVWKQGQPLGLYPSFASFGLTHGILLQFLSNKPYEGQFYVLGDDVVILDDELSEAYRRYMNYLGCPISEDKSISSNKLCEFAGKVITSKRVVPSYKWRELSNDNFLDILRNYGRRALALCTPSQKAVAEAVQHCVEPFGLNWSFPGSNLEKMVELTDSLWKPTERVEQSMIGLFRTICNNYYKCPSNHLRSTVEVEEILKRICTFDEKVAAVLERFLSANWVRAIRDGHMIGAFAGVPRALGSTDLPVESLAPSRVTTLDRYRDILNL